MKFQKVNRPPNKNKGECKGTGFSPCMEEGGRREGSDPKKSKGEGFIPCMGGEGFRSHQIISEKLLIIKKICST